MVRILLTLYLISLTIAVAAGTFLVLGSAFVEEVPGGGGLSGGLPLSISWLLAGVTFLVYTLFGVRGLFGHAAAQGAQEGIGKALAAAVVARAQVTPTSSTGLPDLPAGGSTPQSRKH